MFGPRLRQLRWAAPRLNMGVAMSCAIRCIVGDAWVTEKLQNSCTVRVFVDPHKVFDVLGAAMHL